MKELGFAVLIDFLLGDPYSFPHPVKLMGHIINFEEKTSRKIAKNDKTLKLLGFFIVVINMLMAFFLPFFLLRSLKIYKNLYILVNIYLMYTCIAARSLHFEAGQVKKALNIGLDEARERVSYIVGRETKHLSREEITRATIETVAENTSDGVIAPIFFILILGAPGGLLYKFVNTMDSMLGYKNERYEFLGYFPAIVDDIFNYIPARLTSAFMILSSLGRFDIRRGFKITLRDRKNHKSPNSGYPESSVAGLLGIRLGGDNFYNGTLVKKPTIGDNIHTIDASFIDKSVEIMYRTELLFIVFCFLIIVIIK